jgi:hypothetical protein
LYRIFEADEACTTLKRREVYQPLKQVYQAVAKTDQEHEMKDQPQEPSQHPSSAKLPDRDDAIEASHRSHAPFIDVAKCLRVCFASDPISNHGSRIVSLLFGLPKNQLEK